MSQGILACTGCLCVLCAAHACTYVQGNMRPPAQAALEVDEAAAADLDSQWGGLMIDAERVVDAPASGAGCCTSAAESPEEEQEQIQQQERPTSDGYAVKVDQQEYDQESIEQQSQLGNTASSPGEEE